MKWRKFVVPVLIVGFPIVGVSLCIVRDDRLDRNFRAVTPGMSSQEIERIMGSASWDRDCDRGRLPEVRKPANCTRELGYSATLAWTGFVPSWWVVWLRTEGTVVTTAKITSP
jgi:hypothetical protein